MTNREPASAQLPAILAAAVNPSLASATFVGTWRVLPGIEPCLRSVMRLVCSFTLLAICLGLPATLQAQTVPSPFEHIETRHTIGVNGGYLRIDAGDKEVGPTAGPFGEIHYGLHLTGPLFAEASLSYTRSERTVHRRPVATEPDLEPVEEVDAGIIMLLGGFRFNLTGPRTWRGLAPYITASGGVVSDIVSASSVEATIPEDQRFDFGPGFAAAAGLGTEFYLSDRFSLRLEVKDHLWRYSYPIGLSETEDEREWVHNFGISLGSAIHF